MYSLRRVFRFVAPYRGRLYLALVLLLASTGLGLVGPEVQRMIVDRAILGGEERLLLPLAALLVLASLGRGIALYFRGYLQEWVGQRVVYDLRHSLYAHLQQLSPAYYARTYTGEIMSRVTGDVERLRQFVTSGVVDLLNAAITFTTVALILFSINWQLTLVALSISPLLAYTVLRFDRTIRPAWRAIERQAGVLSTVIQESLAGVRVVKAFAREGFEVDKFAKESQNFADTQVRAAQIWARSFPLIDFLTALSWVLLMGFGGRQVALGRMSLGDLVAFNGYLWSLIWPIRNIGWLINLFEQAGTAAERVLEILQTPVDIKEPHNPVRLKVKGEICFEGVTFAYEPGLTPADTDRSPPIPALENFTLTIRPGQKVAIVGPTGCGKSTVVHLLLRLYDPQSGRITIDGVDLRELDLTSYRRQVGVVQQETFLFSTSIRENIAFGRIDASWEEIREAACRAQADSFIQLLPDKYETVVGERGVGLSGGERQRVAIARAILMDPAILVLDDPTSSVDAETEAEIQAALRELMRGRTTLIISQRVSAVKDADWIVVLDRGRIVQQGRHDELIAEPGVYRRLFGPQLGLSGEREEAAACR
ncbi:MAG: ABC transporter ATP-binding protein [Limnochordales bacterium]|nr:ABC transporter ATP-binding protein [Limnochordales bacterium]